LSASHAAFIITGDPIVGTGVAELNEDITFNVTGDGNVALLVFDEWVIGDGTRDFSTATPALNYVVNGGTVTATTFLSLYDNTQFNFGAVTANDGYFRLSDIAVTTGNTVVIKAGTWNLSATLGFNPTAVGTFQGNVFLADANGVRLSDTQQVAKVPEPSATLLLLVGTSLFFRRRR